MFGASPFYHQTTRRYVAILGTMFNDILITRSNTAGSEIQRMRVPVAYGPIQKFLARIGQDPDLEAPAITLPRMSFEINNISYDGERKLTNAQWHRSVLTDGDTGIQYTPAPYNVEFSLVVYAKYAEDGTKILEQILPYFKPDFTVTAKLVDSLDLTLDIPIVLNSVTTEDVYEADFVTRRAITWTLNFTMKGYYFGPVSERKVIKFVETNIYNTLDVSATRSANTADITITVQPGLLANGSPTMDIAQTIPYANISSTDDWAYIVTIVDNI